MKELYRFSTGLQDWYYTSGDTIHFYDSGDGPKTYEPTTIGRDEPENRSELSKANLTVTLPVTNELAIKLIGSVLDSVVTLTIFETDYVTTDVIWKGRLASVKPDGDAVKLVFESVATSLRRYGLRLKYQRSCPHVLYGRGCNLNKDDFQIGGNVVSVSGNDVVIETVSAHASPYFIAGMLMNEDGIMRFIVGQGAPVGTPPNVQTTLTLFRPIVGMIASDLVLVYPGCDRSRATCEAIFDNLDNNGSFPFIPKINIFAGRAIL